MDKSTALKRLNDWDHQGRHVFTRGDLTALFYDDLPRAFEAGLQRLVADNILERPARGIYVNALAHSKDSYLIEHIAKALRRGHYNYVSLESALSEYGVISQIPVDRLTVMTTGRKGLYKTPYGTIEFIHTKRPIEELLHNTQNLDRPLRLAKLQTAWRDLKRAGRNTQLVNTTALNDGE